MDPSPSSGPSPRRPPALVARARGIAADLERTLAEELERDPTFDGDVALPAAFFVAGYGTVLVETARRRSSPSTQIGDDQASSPSVWNTLA